MSGPPAEVRFASMASDHPTRRDFLADASRTATAGWLALELPWLATLAGCARDDARNGSAFTNLTVAEARAMRAFAAQILPADADTPAADDLGAVHFIDRALGMPFYAGNVSIIRAGLAELDARARSADGRSDFASLGATQQIAMMRQIEHGRFFAAARTLVIIGTFADPSHGGNAGGAGWTMLGIDHQGSYAPPFGWYDAQAGNDPRPRAA